MSIHSDQLLMFFIHFQPLFEGGFMPAHDLPPAGQSRLDAQEGGCVRSEFTYQEKCAPANIARRAC